MWFLLVENIDYSSYLSKYAKMLTTMDVIKLSLMYRDDDNKISLPSL
jgi:hypothetical protein